MWCSSVTYSLFSRCKTYRHVPIIRFDELDPGFGFLCFLVFSPQMGKKMDLYFCSERKKWIDPSEPEKEEAPLPSPPEATPTSTCVVLVCYFFIWSWQNGHLLFIHVSVCVRLYVLWQRITTGGY
eukprot:GHVU01082566.1.p3 GENE.GHVU01082566.1~~GHVU01082566.1.p3  ORF type:complete len:125 (-),score=5.27 GHVU01082566.1:303-677(-)